MNTCEASHSDLTASPTLAPASLLTSPQPSTTECATSGERSSDFNEFKKEKQRSRWEQILETMRMSQEATMTQREIFADARKHGYPDMTNGSRISELVRAGALREAGEKVCRVTGRLVICYALTGQAPQRISQACAPRKVIYAIMRFGKHGLEIVETSSRALTPAANEMLIVAPVNLRQSTKTSDGTSAIPSELPEFHFHVSASSGRKHRAETEGQQMLFA
jgi:hypothetical protein